MLENPKKIDEDWKARARKEKAELAQKIENGELEQEGMDKKFSQYEDKFVNLLASLHHQFEGSLQAGQIEAAIEIAHLVIGLNLKTEGKQTTKEKQIFEEFVPALEEFLEKANQV